MFTFFCLNLHETHLLRVFCANIFQWYIPCEIPGAHIDSHNSVRIIELFSRYPFRATHSSLYHYLHLCIFDLIIIFIHIVVASWISITAYHHHHHNHISTVAVYANIIFRSYSHVRRYSKIKQAKHFFHFFVVSFAFPSFFS